MRKLSELCLPAPGMDPRKFPDNDFGYVDISSVDNRLKRITEAKNFKGFDAPSRARNLMRSGDVILSTTRPNLNAVALVTDEFDGMLCSTGFCVLRSNLELLDNEYLFFWLQSETFIQALVDLTKGALYPAVSDKQVLSQEIPLPDLPTQKRIAGELREKMETVAAARQAIESQLEAVNALPAAYLREVFGASI